jgi:hypothetical protein
MREKIGSVQATNAGTALIVVPAAVAQDTAFPFKPRDKVWVRIEQGRLIVEKAETEKVLP